MSYLYKRSNRFWHLLIANDMVRTAWSPLVEWTRRRHVRFRKRLTERAVAGAVVPAGVSFLRAYGPFPEARIADAVNVLGVKGKGRVEFENSAAMTHATERIARLVKRLECRR